MSVLVRRRRDDAPGHDGFATVLTRAARPLSGALGSAGGTNAVAATPMAEGAIDWTTWRDGDADARLYSVELDTARAFVRVPVALAAALIATRYGGRGGPDATLGRAGVAMAARIAAAVADAVVTAAPALGSVVQVSAVDEPALLPVRHDDRFMAGHWMTAHGPLAIALGLPALACLDTGASREAWSTALANAAATIPVPLRIVVAQPVIPAPRVAALEPGDLLPCAAPVAATLFAGPVRIGTGDIVRGDDGAAQLLVKTIGDK